jgi:AraC-like DNA-binding protein
MKTKSFVSSHLVYALLKYAESLHIDTTSVCQAAGFQSTSHSEPGAQIPADQYYRLWKQITQRAESPNFGLDFARETHQQPVGGVLYTVMFNCPSVGAAMEKLARYHGLATDLIQIRIHQQEGNICYAWEATVDELPSNRHISEAVISWLFFTLQRLAGGKLAINEVRFRHHPPADINVHLKTFDCTLAFSQPRDAIVVPLAGLDLPIPLADRRVLTRLEVLLHEQLQEFYPPDTCSERVSRWMVEILLGGEGLSLEKIAQRASLSTRQLQNKLKREGISYRQLLERVRQEMAQKYLSEPEMSLVDIAFLLGFSNQSAFNHAFKRWTGMSPGKYRNQAN